MNKLQRIASITLYLLAGISVVIAILFYVGEKLPDELGVLAIPKHTGTILSLAYVLFALAAVLTIAFSFLGVFSTKKGLKNALISIGVAAVLIFIAYSLGSTEPIPGRDETASTLKWSDTGLFLAYILAGLAFVGIIASEVTRAFK